MGEGRQVLPAPSPVGDTVPRSGSHSQRRAAHECGEMCIRDRGSQPFVPGCRGGSALLGSRGNAHWQVKEMCIRDRRNISRVHYLLREDLMKLDKLSNEVRLLEQYRINTVEEL